MSLDISLYGEVDLGDKKLTRVEVFDGNSTHNITPMWARAGVYDILYDSDGEICGQYLDALKAGIAKMESEREEFEKLNPKNGWGDYESALRFLQDFTAAVEKYPKAKICIFK